MSDNLGIYRYVLQGLAEDIGHEIEAFILFFKFRCLAFNHAVAQLNGRSTKLLCGH